jgi:hypothetical protein
MLMIESLVKPQPLDNDVAVMKIIQLMGQLTPNDIEYVLRIALQVHEAIGNNEVTVEDLHNGNYKLS